MSIWPAIVAFAIIIGLCWILEKFLKAPPTTGRYASLDGLRGYLACGVVIHHAAVWYFFLRNGKWEAPPSRFYTNIGQVSVDFFFMITAFLFSLKILRGRSEPVKWPELYLSRVLRLAPLYFFSMLLLFLTVGILTGFHLHESAGLLARNVVRWCSFSIYGEPDLNALPMTKIINAGVAWTLPLEWMFYGALPLLAVLVGSRAVPKNFLIGSLLVVGWMLHLARTDLHLAAFGGGILAGLLVHFELTPRWLRGISGSIVAAAALALAFVWGADAFQERAVALLTIAFVIIASGNTFFGVLAWPCSRFLGEFTYSIYLLHGLILFWLFHCVIGSQRAAEFSMPTHWLVIWLTIPVILLVSCLTFHWIEKPAMERSAAVGSWLRKKFTN